QPAWRGDGRGGGQGGVRALTRRANGDSCSHPHADRSATEARRHRLGFDARREAPATRPAFTPRVLRAARRATRRLSLSFCDSVAKSSAFVLSGLLIGTICILHFTSASTRGTVVPQHGCRACTRPVRPARRA